MEFSTKLNIIFKSLKIKNSVISEMSGVDASLVSRFRTSLRVPKPKSKQLHKMCVALVEYVTKTEQIEEFNKICGLPAELTGEALVSAVKVFLLNPNTVATSTLNPKDTRKYTKVEDKTPKLLINFGKKLGDVLDLIDLSNVALSDAVGIDPSLISRFRNGSRLPSTKNSFIQDASHYLYEMVVDKKLTRELYDLMDVNPAWFNNDTDALIEYFINWLCDKNELDQYNATSNFFDNLNTYINTEHEIIGINDLFDEDTQNTNSSLYVGPDGFKTAVKRFAYMTITKMPESVDIYCDQDFDWIDTDFGTDVIKYLTQYVERGGKLNIVHSMNHTTAVQYFEMEKLFPLIATGNVKSYYYDDGANRHFSQTMFIADGLCSVISSCVKGCEDFAEYSFVTGERIAFYKKQFDVMVDFCKPLVSTYIFNDTPHIVDNIKKSSRVTLKYTLPVIGMSEKLFDKLLEANNISGEEAKNAKKYFNKAQFNESDLKKEFTDYVPLVDISRIPSGESFNSVISNPDNAYELVPVNVSGVKMFYTRELYVEHVKGIIKVITKNENYRFIPIESTTYKDLEVILFDEFIAMNFEYKNNDISLIFNHKSINSHFEKYIYTVYKQRYNKCPDNDVMLNQLNDYVRFW